MEGTPLIGIYFASPVCPACTGFTPELVEAYGRWETQGKSFEVVLVTTGIVLADLLEYMAESNMPWRAVSPQSNKASSLIQRYNVRWVPTLVVIDAATKTVTVTGREELVQLGEGAYDFWLAATGGG
jgi:protein-disulfide isomerase-like protein with CxxC motif